MFEFPAYNFTGILNDFFVSFVIKYFHPAQEKKKLVSYGQCSNYFLTSFPGGIRGESLLQNPGISSPYSGILECKNIGKVAGRLQIHIKPYFSLHA